MALASCRVSIISRGKGHSAVAASAYRAAQKLRSERDKQTHNYARKSGVIYTDILTPDGAPHWAHDRQQLWNMVEQTERRKDARLAREVMIALPRELTASQNVALARAYAQTFVTQGMIADLSLHDSGDGNPHAHILLTCRTLQGNGFGKKCREWDDNEQFIAWRKRYGDLTNQFLERAGHEQRIDVRSYAAQGIYQIPTIHLGSYAHRQEQDGIQTDRGDINRHIARQNRQLEEISREIKEAQQKRDALIKEIEEEEKREQLKEKETQTGHEDRYHAATKRYFERRKLERQEKQNQEQETPPHHTPTTDWGRYRYGNNYKRGHDP